MLRVGRWRAGGERDGREERSQVEGESRGWARERFQMVVGGGGRRRRRRRGSHLGGRGEERVECRRSSRELETWRKQSARRDCDAQSMTWGYMREAKARWSQRELGCLTGREGGGKGRRVQGDVEPPLSLSLLPSFIPLDYRLFSASARMVDKLTDLLLPQTKKEALSREGKVRTKAG